VKIGIVGTGISGLSAAHLLCRNHDVTVYEAEDRIGGHTHTVDVDEHGRRLPVDTGFIVFNEPNYPHLNRLFDLLNVQSQASDMSFSVHCDRTGLEYSGGSLAGLVARKRNLVSPAFLSMVKDLLKYYRKGQESLRNGLTDKMTVAEFIEKNGLGQNFVDYYLYPLGSSLWSCSLDEFSRFPILFVLEFLQNHQLLQTRGRPRWRTVKGGSREYVKVLIQPFRDSIRTATPVRQVQRNGRSVRVTTEQGDIDEFDEVIVATHADQALRLVHDAEPEEKDILAYFPYRQNDVILHTDTGILPNHPAAWASWNYRVASTQQSKATVTYNMNMLQMIESEHTYCVSLNPATAIDPAKVIRRFSYSHPSFEPGRSSAQERHADLIRRRGISYCGAYWGYGFHEDGLRSALHVCAAFGEDLS